MVLRPDGGGKFESVTLRPSVTIAAGSDEKRAMDLHETAHDMCFIAASVSIPVQHQPVIKVAQAAARPVQRPTDIEARP
jgi:organic hydroperoxide reductase OsmC/OhrA